MACPRRTSTHSTLTERSRSSTRSRATSSGGPRVLQSQHSRLGRSADGQLLLERPPDGPGGIGRHRRDLLGARQHHRRRQPGRAEGRAEQGRGDAVHRTRHQPEGPGRDGGRHRLRPDQPRFAGPDGRGDAQDPARPAGRNPGQCRYGLLGPEPRRHRRALHARRPSDAPRRLHPGPVRALPPRAGEQSCPSDPTALPAAAATSQTRPSGFAYAVPALLLVLAFFVLPVAALFCCAARDRT